MKKRLLIGVLTSTIVLIILILVILPKSTITGFSIYQNTVNEEFLDTLKIKAGVECLKNSQCSEGYGCVDNKCVEESKIDVCKRIKLSGGARKLKQGDSMNSIKSVFTDGQLPYLLSDGEIVEIVDDKLIEHFYIQAIFIGDNTIEKENDNYVINNSAGNVFTYKLIFSKGVDFSSKNIQGQVLRILGKEYVIDSKSDNSEIILVSDNKKLKLEDGKKTKVKRGLFFSEVKGNFVKINKGEGGKVIGFEIGFDMDEKKLKVKESYKESVFEGVKISFDDVNDYGFADVKVGGRC